MSRILLFIMLLMALGFTQQNVRSAPSTNWRVICLTALSEQVPVNVNATDINDALDQAHSGAANCTALAACNTDVLDCPDA